MSDVKTDRTSDLVVILTEQRLQLVRMFITMLRRYGQRRWHPPGFTELRVTQQLVPLCKLVVIVCTTHAQVFLALRAIFDCLGSLLFLTAGITRPVKIILQTYFRGRCHDRAGRGRV